MRVLGFSGGPEVIYENLYNFLDSQAHDSASKEVLWQNYLSLKLSLPPHISLHQVKKVCTDSKFDNLFYIGNSYDTKFQVGVSAEVFGVLTLANSEKTVGNLLHENGETEEGKAQGIVNELMELWSQRLILLQP